ncbi:unnamed protein product [Rotaria magnacalcarata]|uniref:Uncharacterized protein n=2 Tax=Rotaria magnacalcarata TaxID=392030 RepID=A0A814GXB8_9BILA|nr:unnamed protein product [Rotaria magnacalcarata]CAF1483755.1 unnamed protein product [Rotaria magnacalcarata]CAF3884796.1 unnamed protein product [Rotaria magnacalcarata]CAF4305267.1 unnamed protein product [Rotaria magnacalcarata]
MGVVSSMCKPKKRGKHNAIVFNEYTQTISASPSPSSDYTQCSAMSREPTHSSSFGYHYYLPPNQQIREQPDFPLFSRPFFLPYNGENNDSFRHSNPYVAQAYNHIDIPAPPSIFNTDRLRTILTTSIADLSPVASTSDIIQTTGDECRLESNRTLRHVESSTTTHNKNDQSIEETFDDNSHLVKRSVSAPIDMFLIDISNEQVLAGQPVSINIRHLLLDTLENHHTNSSTPIRIEPNSITTYAHENLLDYIPYVCEKYQNPTIDSDQVTRNTLHVRIPSQFSRSFNILA